MLVVTRKEQQSILLTGGIRITVTEISGGKIRIGIDCPQSIEIWREEIAPTEFMKEFQCDRVQK